VTAVTARYVAYATAHGKTPDAMLAADRESWPGGSMVGFTLWMDARWREWLEMHKDRRRSALTDADHAAFDAWLGDAA
jgi:hypothetical protein